MPTKKYVRSKSQCAIDSDDESQLSDEDPPAKKCTHSKLQAPIDESQVGDQDPPTKKHTHSQIPTLDRMTIILRKGITLTSELLNSLERMIKTQFINLTCHQMNINYTKQAVLDPGQASDSEDRMSEADVDLPTMCSGMYCSDLIPDEVSTQLRAVLICHAHLSQENKINVRLVTDICILIGCEHKRLEYINLAAEENWPATTIDFQEIPNCVLEMYDELKMIMFVREAREHLFLWNCFEANLKVDGWSTSRFAKMQPSDISLKSKVWRRSCGG